MTRSTVSGGGRRRRSCASSAASSRRTFSASRSYLMITLSVSSMSSLVQMLRAEHDQGLRPVQRLADARRLAQVEAAQPLDRAHQLAGELLADLRRLQTHDLQLDVRPRVVELQVQAASLEGLAQLPRAVAREHDDRHRLRLDRPDLRDRHLEVGQELEQEGLELLVRPVDLVDEQHRGCARPAGPEGSGAPPGSSPRRTRPPGRAARPPPRAGRPCGPRSSPIFSRSTCV